MTREEFIAAFERASKEAKKLEPWVVREFERWFGKHSVRKETK